MSSILEINLEEIINKIIEKEGYKTYKLNKKEISTNGGSFLAGLCEIDVKGETNDGYTETNLFVKKLKGGNDMAWLPLDDLFKIELFAYRELSDIFTELQENEVPTQERYKIIKSYEGSSIEAIILDNYARKGFIKYPRMDLVSLKYAEMAIKQLAKFHCLSFVLEERRPEYFNGKIKDMKYPIIFGDEWQRFLENMIKLSVKYVDDDIKNKIESIYYKLADKYAQYFQDKTVKQCLCHGDYKTNNILVKIDKGEVTDIVPVDYQLLHYGCPVLDFIFYIFMSTDHNFRKAHLTDLKDLYHGTLKSFLEYFSIDVERIYPKKMFDKVYKEKLDYGLMLGFIFLPLAMVCEEKVEKKSEEVSGLSFQVNDMFRDRQCGMIKEFEEWGYIV